jgi:phage terminase large subunit
MSASSVQLPDWAECLFTPSRYKALHGGRGGGKSRSVASALVIKASQKPERILCAREVQRSIKDSVKRLLDDEIDRMGLRGSFFESTETEIRGVNGSLFLFAGLRGNAAGIKSLEGVTIAWTEEASTISQGSLDTLVPTIRAPNSELWFTWNPDLETDPIDAMFRGEDGPPPDTILREVTFEHNPWFPDVLKGEMEYDRGRDPEKYAHVWLGQYRRNAEARVFKNWSVEEFEAPASAIHRLGADFGYSVDPSCAVRCHIDGRKLYVDHEAYRIGCEIDQMPDLFMSIPDAEKWPMVGDTSRPETISYLRRHGFPKVTAAIKGARSVEEGVSFLQSYDIVVHPRCSHLIDELTLYAYETDPLTGVVLPRLEDKNNHLIDSLRYACEGARRALAVRPVPTPVFVPPMRTAFNRARV